MVKARPKKLAVFDVDGTIFRSSLLIELVSELVRQGVFKKSAAKRYERDKVKWLDRKGDYENYIMAVVAAFRKSLEGVAYRDFLRVATRVAALHRDRVYRYTRDLVRTLRKKGYYLVAVSHSPRGIVEPFAKTLGFHKTYGLWYELDGAGKFSGAVLYQELMADKAKIVKRVLEKERVTLRGSVGVGDTESDIPFLKMVDRPVCFNPNRKLLRVARRNDWRVVVERKDVVYEL